MQTNKLLSKLKRPMTSKDQETSGECKTEI